MAQYSIKDIEVLSGIKAHTLRIWELRYALLKPERTDTNIRYYSDEQLKKILNVSLLNRYGYKISKIAGMSDAELKRKVTEITDQHQTPDDLLDALTQSMVDFDEAKFEKFLSVAIAKHGFENAFTQIVFPFLTRTGILWSTGAILPVQEHFISNLIRRKVIVAIDSQFLTENKHTSRFLLFLPEGETHELMLLFIEYIFRKNNQRVAYIGSSLPFSDIDIVNKTFNPHYLVTYITVPMQDPTLQVFINNLSNAFPRKTIMIGGAQMQLQKPKLPSNVKAIDSMEQMLRLMHS